MPTMSPTSRGYKAKAKKDPASLPKPWKELKKKKPQKRATAKDSATFHKKIAAKYKKSEADMPRRPAMTEAGSYSHKGWSWRVTEEEAAANRKRKKK